MSQLPNLDQERILVELTCLDCLDSLTVQGDRRAPIVEVRRCPGSALQTLCFAKPELTQQRPFIFPRGQRGGSIKALAFARV